MDIPVHVSRLKRPVAGVSVLALTSLIALAGCGDTSDAGSASAATTPAGQTATADSTSATPNVLLVIADDFGIDASPCYDSVPGAEKPDMPTLESLCDSGIVFENMTVNPQCTPTRATVLTGRYGVRTGVGAVNAVLPTTETSIQAVLGEQTAYDSAVIGKWHLAGSARQASTDHVAALGVPYYAGFLAGQLPDYENWELSSNGTTTPQTTYATTALTDLAINWIAENDDAPWFTWLAYSAPHTPFHLPPDALHTRELSGEAADIEANPREYYFAAAEALDTELGRLLDSMSAEERAETLVVFMGDNGTPQQVVQGYAANHAKGSVYDGGVHVPLVVSGAGVTRTGARESGLVNGTDLFATIAEVAGATPTTGTDSVSFAPLLKAEASALREYAYTETFGSSTPNGQSLPSAWAIRDERYRMVQFVDGATELYDVSKDPLETTDLLADTTTAKESAAIVARLTAAAAKVRS